MSSLYARFARPSPVLPTTRLLPAQDDELDAAFADDAPDDASPPHALANSEGTTQSDRLVRGSTPALSTAQPPPPPVRSLMTQASSSTSISAVESSPAYDFERDPTLDARPVIIHRSLRERLMPGSLYSRVDTHDTDSPAPIPRQRTKIMGTGIQNDGVFANLSAKPDGPPHSSSPMNNNNNHGNMEIVGGDDRDAVNNKEENLPSYDTALQDSSPPYWETTVTLPGGSYGVLGPDDVLVEGLPVGNLFGFAWNLLVSMSFQFVGFLLTYLLHTTHAARNGSRSGLGITLIQYGLYLRTRANELANMTPEEFIHGGPGWNITSVASVTGIGGTDVVEDDTDPWGLFGTPTRHDWDGSSTTSARVMSNSNSTGSWPGVSQVMPTEEQLHMSSVANEWISYLLMTGGWFLLLGGMLNYWRAVRWARAVRGEASAGGTTA